MASDLSLRVVIGYGNDLRSDDGAGIHVATRLAAQLPQSLVIVTHQLTPDLAEDIATAEQVIFVDAYAAHESNARLRIDKISGDDSYNPSALGHHGAPQGLMHLAHQLFGKTPDAWVVGIPAFCFDAGETISPETLHRINEAVALIEGRALFDV